jgi:hypothetical protein
MREGWATLERSSPTLFIAAGALLVGYAALNGVAALTDVAYTSVEDILGPAGLALGFLGLLGLYPEGADRHRGLARVGAVCAGLGLVSFAVIVAGSLAEFAGLGPSEPPAVLLLVATGMIPGYLSFGAVSLRSPDHVRPLGYLLLVPGVVFAAMLSQPFVYGQLGLLSETTMAWSNFVISSCQALGHLAIGYTLRAGWVAHERDAPATDITAG